MTTYGQKCDGSGSWKQKTLKSFLWRNQNQLQQIHKTAIT